MSRAIVLFLVGAFAVWLCHQIGLVASAYNIARPMFVVDGGQACIDELDAQGIEHRPLGTLREGRCTVKNAVKITEFPGTSLSGPLTLTCDSAKTFGRFFQELGASYIGHLGSFNCRTIRQTGFISEHGYGTAVDITQVDEALVKKDWGDNTQKGEKLARAARIAETIFSNTLTPESNAAHVDHLHLDCGLGL